MPSVLKPGHRTTEFLVTVLTDIGLLAAALAGSLSPRYAAVAAAVAQAAYALSRGLAKAGARPVAPTAPMTPTAPQ